MPQNADKYIVVKYTLYHYSEYEPALQTILSLFLPLVSLLISGGLALPYLTLRKWGQH